MKHDEMEEALKRTEIEIDVICAMVAKMLKEKNRSYGGSSLQPLRLFSKGSPLDGINVRIDDKLSRILKGDENAFHEDPEWDLLGYFILRLIAKARQTGKGYAPPVNKASPMQEEMDMVDLPLPGPLTLQHILEQLENLDLASRGPLESAYHRVEFFSDGSGSIVRDKVWERRFSNPHDAYKKIKERLREYKSPKTPEH